MSAHGGWCQAPASGWRAARQQGKRAEADELLAPIYGWFTEGLDTADLHDARAPLEALRITAGGADAAIVLSTPWR
jgi:hypothetical protein